MDGAPLSKRALEVALTEHPDAEITVLHVIDPTDPAYGYASDVEITREPPHGSSEWYDRADEHAEEILDEARAIADEHDRDLTTAVAINEPARAIVDYVRDNDVDHVIVGSHGRADDSEIALGSVTEVVAFRSPVRVTLIR